MQESQLAVLEPVDTSAQVPFVQPTPCPDMTFEKKERLEREAALVIADAMIHAPFTQDRGRIHVDIDVQYDQHFALILMQAIRNTPDCDLSQVIIGTSDYVVLFVDRQD